MNAFKFFMIMLTSVLGADGPGLLRGAARETSDQILGMFNEIMDEPKRELQTPVEFSYSMSYSYEG